jgi:isopentenyldiphosphate isomerase
MEYLDIVNDQDEVTGRATRDNVYLNKFMHRIVHVLIFNDKEEMALQKRSKNVSWCPRHWSTPVGGHVQSGETFEQAAKREYQEELGISSEIRFAFKDTYNDNRGLKKFLVTFKTTYNGPFTIDKNDVEEIRFFTLDQIRQMIATGEKFHPELLFLLKNHYSI